MPFITLALTALLLLYLVWGGLERALGRAYLPLALLAASFGSILMYAVTVGYRMINGQPDYALRQDAWVLIVVLLIPLLLISWQYRLRAVLAFSVGTALFELLLAVGLHRLGGPAVQDAASLVVVRGLLFVLIGSIIVQLMNNQRRQRAELAEANRQLTRYASTLEQLTISRERNRMARDLHDTLAHSLSAVAVQLEATRRVWDAEPDTARALLNRSLEAVRGGLGEARRAIHDLRAAPLEDLGLALALRALAESTAERAGLQCEVRVPEQISGIAPEVEQSVYRIAHEALENIARHAAGATCVRLWIEQRSGRLMVEVGDDGTGFDPGAATDGHYGLIGMQERAAMIGGELAVESAVGKGTSVRLVVEG
jgi:signal transduction histidine kinase